MSKRAGIFFALMLAAVMIFSSCAGASVNIITGKNDFLFAKTSANYDFLSDYQGGLLWTDEQLAQISALLSDTYEFYANMGITYVTAVIPSKMTVYSDLLPSNIKKEGQTRLEQLKGHLDGSNTALIDLTEKLRTAKDSAGYNLYDNTGADINAVGLFYVYQGLCESIPKLKLKGLLQYMNIDGAIKEVEEYGKQYAMEIEKELKIMNSSLTLDTDVYKLNYEVGESMGNQVSKLTGNEKYIRDETAKIILQASAQLNNGLMPFFSNTFQQVTYQTNHNVFVFESRPDVVIGLYSEESLSDLLVDPLGGSGADGDTTATPLLIAQANCVAPYDGGDFIMLHGAVEPGSTVSITGDNIEPFVQVCRTGKYYMGVWLKSSKDTTITITAQNGSKKVSEPLNTSVAYSGRRIERVIPGTENHVFYQDCMDDYFGYNTFSEQDLANIKDSVLKKVKKIREMSGKDTKVLYVIPPNPVHIYSERLPQYIKDMQTSGRNRLKEVVEYLGDLGENVRVIDLSQTFLDLRKYGEEDYLYHLSDNHWTQYGAWHGYEVIMNNLYEMSGNEAVKPIPQDQFELTPYQWGGSDMMGELHFPGDVVKENTMRFLPKFEPRSKLVEGEIKDVGYFYNQMFGQLRFQIDDASLPTCLFLRDSFSAGIRPFINENFSDIMYEEVWQYRLRNSTFEKLKPDFVVIEFVERNIWNIMN